jgi:L-lactate dehydrogenase complex protein LldG
MTTSPLSLSITKRLNALGAFGKNSKESRYSQVLKYLKHKNPPVTPSYIHSAETIPLFCEKAQKAGASCHHAQDIHAIPNIIEHNIIKPQKKHITLHAPSLPWLSSLEWKPSILLSSEKPHINSVWGLSCAFSAAAETGTLFVGSSPSMPIALNFIPEKSIVILDTSTLHLSLEEAAVIANASQPRALSLVTGPSRTADIAQQLVMGAHGPKTLDIILVPNLNP